MSIFFDRVNIFSLYQYLFLGSVFFHCVNIFFIMSIFYQLSSLFRLSTPTTPCLRWRRFQILFVATTSSYFYSKCLIFFFAPGFGQKKGIVGVKNVLGDFMTSLKSNPGHPQRYHKELWLGHRALFRPS